MDQRQGHWHRWRRLHVNSSEPAGDQQGRVPNKSCLDKCFFVTVSKVLVIELHFCYFAAWKDGSALVK